MTWKSVKLGSVCKLVNGKAFKPSDWSKEGIRIVRIQNLNDPTKEFNHWPGPLNKQVEVNDGDLLLAWSGTPGTSFGAHIWHNGKAILNQHIFRFDLYDEAIDREWAKISINYKLNVLIDQAHGGVGLQHVTKPMVENLDIPLPPLPTQKQIAAILDKADSARQKRRQANQLTEQFLQSAFLEMFGDPITHSKEWETGVVAEAIDLSEYGTSEKSNAEKRGWPIIGMGNITYGGQLDLTELKYVELPDKQYERMRLRWGDIIFNRTNSTELVGKTTFWNLKMNAVIASYLVKLRLNPMFDPAWFSALLNTPYYKNLFMQRCKKAVGQSNISPTLLREFPMYKPPLAKQKEFGALVEKVELLRAKQLVSVKELEDLFNSLMQRAFKGELVG